jgi:murein DD-endopeptidase MepM/ murein hydrolase activator NlpD
MGARFLRFSMLAVVLLWIATPQLAASKTVEELRAELQAKKNNLKAVEQRIEEFRQNIQLKKKEAKTLGEQIEIIEGNIGELEISLERTVAELDTTVTEVETVSVEITEKEQEIAAQKDLLAEYIRALHALDQQSTVTVFLKYNTFSEVLSEAATFTELQNRAQDTLNSIQSLHRELTEKRRDLEDFKSTLLALQRRQKQQQQTLAVQRDSKERILELTQAQEQQFKSLLAASQQTHQQAEAEIRRIDAALREELEKQSGGKLPSVGTMSWPVEPIFGVSCEFHCAGYPYAYLIGPHAGIDIPTYVGTPIRAPADGYIGRLHDSRGPGYSYILMIHGDDISTVFGHASGFGDVAEGQRVSRGTVIGYTGGAPGMRGAGLSSGPHLHFEVRKNNATINPRGFL